MMKVSYHFLEMDERGKPKITPGLGEVLPAVYDELKFHWLPGFIKELMRHGIRTPRHPDDQDWEAAFQIDCSKPGASPTGYLLFWPPVNGRRVSFRLVHRPLTQEAIRKRLGSAMRLRGRPSKKKKQPPL